MLIILKHRLSEIAWLTACVLNATLAAKFQVLIYFHAGFRYYLNFAQTYLIVSLIFMQDSGKFFTKLQACFTLNASCLPDC